MKYYIRLDRQREKKPLLSAYGSEETCKDENLSRAQLRKLTEI